MHGEAADLPRRVHDGVDDLDRLATGVLLVDAPCPSCRAPVRFDPVDVVQRGQPIAVTSVTDGDDDLARHVARTLGFDLLQLDDLVVLDGTDGLSPFVLDTRCPGCGRSLLAVASYGEFQPARWCLVAEGLVTEPAEAATSAAGAGDAGDGSEANDQGSDPDARTSTGPSRDDAQADSGSTGPGTGTGNDPTGAPASAGRATAIRRDRFVVVGAVLAAVALIVWLHTTAYNAWSETRYLAARGETVMAEIVGRDESGSPGDANVYRLTYRFRGVDADGRSFTREATRQVSGSTFEAARAADTVEVRYDPDDPDRSDVAANDRWSVVILITVVADVLLIAAVVAVIRSARRNRAERAA